MMAKLGRVWSLIDSEILGTFYILQRHLEPGRILPTFLEKFSKEFENKAISITFERQRGRFFVGFHNGYVWMFDSASKAETTLFLLNEPIFGLRSLKNDLLFVAGETSIKILRSSGSQSAFPSTSFIGGGSLKARLEGAIITSYAIEEGKVFIGSSKGKVLVFNIDGEKATFSDSFSSSSLPILTLAVSKRSSRSFSHLFVNDGNVVFVWQTKNISNVLCELFRQPLSHSQNHKKKFWETFPFRRLIITNPEKCWLWVCQFSGFKKNGTIVFFSSKDGSIVAAYQFTQSRITRILLYEDREILFLGTGNGEILVFPLTQIFKVGGIPDDLLKYSD